MKKFLVILALPVLGSVAWFCQRTVPVPDSAQANMVIAGLGGFRGVLSEIVWSVRTGCRMKGAMPRWRNWRIC